MHSILTTMQDSFFAADDGDISIIQADGNSHTTILHIKEPIETNRTAWLAHIKRTDFLKVHWNWGNEKNLYGRHGCERRYEAVRTDQKENLNLKIWQIKSKWTLLYNSHVLLV
jgi:hypothetical protein